MLNRQLFFISLIGFLLISGINVSPQANKEDTPEAAGLRKKADDLIIARKFRDAIPAYEVLLEKSPDDYRAFYNMACAYSLLGKKEQAVECLQKAIEAGFLDFKHIEADRDFSTLKSYDGYQKLLRDKNQLVKKAGEKKIERFRKQYGADYTSDIDEQRMFLFVSCTDSKTLEEIKKSLAEFSDASRKFVFQGKITTINYLNIIIARDEDYQKLNTMEGKPDGFYLNDTRMLVTKDTGVTLKHELIHALHHLDREVHKQKNDHATWIKEGLAVCLQEAVIMTGGRLSVPYTKQLQGAKILIQDDRRYIPWRRMMQMDEQSFYQKSINSTFRVPDTYPEAGAIFYWLDKTGKLTSFYQLYLEMSANDLAGIKTLEKLFNGKKLEEIEEIWKQWILKEEPAKGNNK